MLIFLLMVPPFCLDIVQENACIFLAYVSCTNVVCALVACGPLRLGDSVLMPFPSLSSAITAAARSPPHVTAHADVAREIQTSILGTVPNFNCISSTVASTPAHGAHSKQPIRYPGSPATSFMIVSPSKGALKRLPPLILINLQCPPRLTHYKRRAC